MSNPHTKQRVEVAARTGTCPLAGLPAVAFLHEGPGPSGRGSCASARREVSAQGAVLRGRCTDQRSLTIQYPRPEHRPWFLLGILGTFAAFGTAAWIVGAHFVRRAQWMSVLEVVEFLCWEVALLGVTVLCSVLFVALVRGPPARARRTAVSEELPLFFAM